MDKKKTLKTIVATLLLLFVATVAKAQEPVRIQFGEREYQYGVGNENIRIYFNLFGSEGESLPGITQDQFKKYFSFYEDGEPVDDYVVTALSETARRIPKDYTFSILLDRNVPQEGKTQIIKSLKSLVDMAPDSCVFISVYGNGVGESLRATKDNFHEIEKTYMQPSQNKYFYSGVYAKLAEFAPEGTDLSGIVSLPEATYRQNPVIARRAALNPGRNILMIFAEGQRPPELEQLDYTDLERFQAENGASLPKVYGFYYTPTGEEEYITLTLELLAHPQDAGGNRIKDIQGMVESSGSMDMMLEKFQETIEEAAYCYVLEYPAREGRTYAGSVTYAADWGREQIGEATFTVGSAERPWPEREQTAASIFIQGLVAIAVTVLTFIFFLLVMRIVVPWVRSLTFKRKYYKKYVPEENVTRRICHYCKQDIRPGQTIVTKCRHWMHRHCWEQNEYKCAEFGQNCRDGIQDHIEWKRIFTARSLRDSSQTVAGVLAGLVSWIVYEICGRGSIFHALSKWIVGLVFSGDSASHLMVGDCVAKTSAFLMIGMLLGFFLSLVFRYNEGIKGRDWKYILKILGLSVFTSAVGFLAFAVGAWIFCLIVKGGSGSYVGWYASLPAYVLFSICVSLALTVKSSIPFKSAVLGGLISAVIGFLVLYFTKFTGRNYEWINMLLDFIIYGGGLGASLITVRMLAEKYFLEIMNGVKKGQRIPIHKWMNATGGGNKVTIGMTGDCEIQMYWEKNNKVAKEHAELYIDHDRMLPVIKPLAKGVVYNNRAELPSSKPAVLSNGDMFTIGDTIFKYEEL